MGSQLIILVQALNVLSHDLPDDMTFELLVYTMQIP